MRNWSSFWGWTIGLWALGLAESTGWTEVPDLVVSVKVEGEEAKVQLDYAAGVDEAAVRADVVSIQQAWPDVSSVAWSRGKEGITLSLRTKALVEPGTGRLDLGLLAAGLGLHRAFSVLYFPKTPPPPSKEGPPLVVGPYQVRQQWVGSGWVFDFVWGRLSGVGPAPSSFSEGRRSEPVGPWPWWLGGVALLMMGGLAAVILRMRGRKQP